MRVRREEKIGIIDSMDLDETNTTEIHETNMMDRTMDRQELLERYASGERNFGDVDLRGAQLDGVILSGVQLRGADLGGASLNGANLWGADLTGAQLENASLSGTDLRRARLVGANLRGADLSEALLVSANLRGALLRGTNLRGANLYCAQLSAAEQQVAVGAGARLYDPALSTRRHPVRAVVG
jgi:uncharacterized protein YjbI with pentapeptide repeats